MTVPASYGMLAVSLLGGIGLFLLGMTMLTDGLKLAAGRALERILAAWTRTRLHGLATGVLLTALVQSSTAMTVAAIGFVNAGLLSFTSALWVVFGANFGSSVTGWLVAWLGFKLKIDVFALPFIGIGMALKLTGEGSRRGALGMAVAGFGLLFLGIDMLKQGFEGLGPQALPPLGGDVLSVALAVLAGVALTIVLQASSATLALVLTAVAGGMMPVEAGAGMVIGANVGTTLTGILAAIGATSNARRLAAAHVLFNVVTAVVALAVFSPLLDLIHAMGVWLTGSGDVVMQLVLFHSLFNLLGVLLMWPLSGPLVRFLLARFGSADEDAARPRYLDRNVAAVPVLALQALRHELARMGSLALALARDAAQPHVQPDARLARQFGTVEHLQREIGWFVSEVSRRQMHRDVAAQLPELLRIATHFDTLARVMHHIGQQGHPAAPLPAQGLQGGIDGLVQPVFEAAQAFFTAADPGAGVGSSSAGGPWLAVEAREGFEAAYQAAKAGLLQAGAGGTLDVVAVYEGLARLSDLRRAVGQGFKAVQRMAALPELSALGDGAATPWPGGSDGGLRGVESAD